MTERKKWNFETKNKTIPIAGLSDGFSWIEEFYVSPDGEKVAAIAATTDETFKVVSVSENSREDWEEFDKIWRLRFLPDGRLYAFVLKDEEWTVAIDGKTWETGFDYIWKPLVRNNGKSIAVSVNNGGDYAMALNGEPWETGFVNITNSAISNNGDKTAACVQVESAGEGEIFKFQQGLFTVAVDGKPWDTKFVNVWDMTFSDDGASLAAEVRTNLYDYTIAVDGNIWDHHYQAVWKPIFKPNSTSVVAPVRVGGKWGLAIDGKMAWDAQFLQCRQPQFSPDGSKLVAIVSPAYGKWTMALDGDNWTSLFDTYLIDPTFSEDSRTLAAICMNAGHVSLVVNDTVWSNTFDLIEDFSVSSNGENIVAVGKKDGRYSIVINDKIIQENLTKVWKPVFNEEGSKVILKTLEGNTYLRSVFTI